MATPRALVVGLLLLSTALAQPPTAINVREAGASGSAFQTRATTTAGSNQITVDDPGDFQVGQEVSVSRCNVRYERALRWGPTEPYSSCVPLKDSAEMRGYDGSAGSWLVYLIEIDGDAPLTFRWSDDCARTWKGTKVPVTFDWQPLSNGTELKLAKQPWQRGHMITFSARDQLVTTIDQIEGKTLTLHATANRTATDAVIKHSDWLALQRAVERGVKEHRNVFFPAGTYRLTRSLYVGDAAVTFEGVDAPHVLMDITDGEGAVFQLARGSEVTIRNFSMVGHTGLAEAAGAFTTSSGFGFWAAALKGCNAVSIMGTERVLIENVHARRMASECFYSQGPSRTSTNEPPQYTKSLTYLRCSVTDCAANAFNNNDTAENTSVLYCRIDGAGWHAWEGPSRYIRLIGNYVRNAGPFTVGDMSHRYPDLNDLGCGQAIVQDNVFEGIGRCGGVAINHGASQVVVANNLFINFNGPAITASSATVRTSYPSSTVNILGNLIDLTYTGEKPASRTGISVSASHTVVADNQVYVRNGPDPKVTGIQVAEPALDVIVRDNLVRGCGTGLSTRRAASRVTAVVDDQTFVEQGLPLEWEHSHRYRGWPVTWLSDPPAESVIEDFDPQTLRFTLRAPRAMKPGDRFEVHPPGGADWLLRHNTITGCTNPVVLDSYGSATSAFEDNTLTRGDATGVKQAVSVTGRFRLRGNRFSGFDEAGCVGLLLGPDRLGRPVPNLVLDNSFDGCPKPIGESRAGLWAACTARGNLTDGQPTEKP